MHQLPLQGSARYGVIRLALLIAAAASAAHAQQVVIEGQRATTPARSCVQQVERDGVREPAAVKAAIQQCMRTRMAERNTQSAPARPQGLTK
jgi:hypothetical protein